MGMARSDERASELMGSAALENKRLLVRGIEEEEEEEEGESSTENAEGRFNKLTGDIDDADEGCGRKAVCG